MAGEVDPQSDVSLMGGRARTLHLKTLRKQWQIITLQVVSTIALVWMYLEVVSTYVVNSIDHTILFESLEQLVGEVPIGDWLIGSGRTGLARFYVPIVLGLGLGGSMAVLAFQSPRVQQRIKLGFIITLMTLLIGRLVLTWIPSMLFSWDLRPPSESELKTLEWPLLMILSLVILFIYLLPVIMGTRGIWGLSRRSIGWAIGFTLLFLGIHAILTFPLIKTQLGDWGSNLISLESQAGDPTVGIFGFDLVTPEQFSLILIAVLIMVFQESGFGVIRYLEYAYAAAHPAQYAAWLKEEEGELAGAVKSAAREEALLTEQHSAIAHALAKLTDYITISWIFVFLWNLDEYIPPCRCIEVSPAYIIHHHFPHLL